MRVLEADRLKRYEEIVKCHKENKEKEKVIYKEKETANKEPKEKIYENDALGIIFIISKESIKSIFFYNILY
jgi:hypothetical protein